MTMAATMSPRTAVTTTAQRRLHNNQLMATMWAEDTREKDNFWGVERRRGFEFFCERAMTTMTTTTMATMERTAATRTAATTTTTMTTGMNIKMM
jgi:hypothetical protein